jgi:plasmid stability protein
MAKVLIRNLDERTVARLKQRAARNDRSLQAELQTIVERAALVDIVEGRALAARVRRKLSNRKHSDSTASIADDRRR